MQGHVDLVKEHFFAFRESPHEGPVHLLNLIRLRKRADYPDGRDASGAEAYRTYGQVSEPVLARLGVKIIWEGRFQSMLIGPESERWDLCFIAEYPDVSAFTEIIRDHLYREAAAHRKAAVEDSRLVALGPLPQGIRFGQFLEG